MLPLFSIIQSCFTSLTIPQLKPTDHSSTFSVTIDIIGILLLWNSVFFYMRIWNEGGYLARMIRECISGMKIFFCVYLMYLLSFAQGFYFLSYANANPDYHFVPSLWHAFRYCYLAALGDFTYKPYFSGSTIVSGRLIQAKNRNDPHTELPSISLVFPIIYSQ